MTDQVDDQCFTEVVRNAFILQELVNVEEIAWMLPIKCSCNLACKQIRKRHHIDLCIPKLIFGLCANFHQLGFIDATAQYWIDLDLDLNAL